MSASHAYAECCDRQTLLDRTVRVWIGGGWVRLCREGMGCATEAKEPKA